MKKYNYFNNKTIWITGASSGIGEALAVQLSNYIDVKLILSSRSRDQLERVKDRCANPHIVHIIPLDLADIESHKTIFESNVDILSNVDIVFHNGGISQRSLAVDTQIEVYRKLIEVNYLGTVSLTLNLLPYFKNNNAGHFVVTSSSAGKFGVPLRSGYSASKFALHGFFEGLRAELFNSLINITIVCPGYIHTDISKHALTSDGTPQGTMDEAQLNGMKVEDCAQEILSSVSLKRAESYIGGFKESTLAILVSRFFPNLFRKIIGKTVLK